MPRPGRGSQQRATRNTFTQKGAEVQKIDQGGIWAQIVSSYPNPDFDSVCFSEAVGSGSGNDDEFVSVAKWVYKCRRLIRKSSHIVASIKNGEIFHPCYFVEPSTEKRFETGTIVWLEPLPQLNGYLMIPGGLSRCHPIYGYGSYGSYGSGSDIGSGYLGYGSGTSGIGSGSGLVDCASLLNCLCVQKDSQGRVTGVFIRNPNGSLTEIMECGSGGIGSGSGLEYCCPPDGTEYVLEYNFTVFGKSYSGTTAPQSWGPGIIGWSGTFSDPGCEWGLQWTFYTHCSPIGGILAPFFGAVCGNMICDVHAWPENWDITVTGCPGLPTAYFTIKQGNCASGTFILRPA
jgi:hypothetical protein